MNPRTFGANETLIKGVTSLDDTEEISFITSQGMEIALSAKAGDTIRLRSSRSGNILIFRAKIRGLASTFPGFVFSSYKVVAGRHSVCISFDSANNMLAQILEKD